MAIRGEIINEAEGSSNSDDDVNSTDENEEEFSTTANEGDNESSDGDESVLSVDKNGIISNAGWADSIAKILKTNKPKKKKTLVLSKAKKLNDVKRVKPKAAGFEVATADGEVREEKIELKQEKDAETEAVRRKKKKELPNLRVKPNILEKDRERTLAKIATKGVVHLFNAVKMQQKVINDKLQEAGPLEVRKEKVLKNIDKRAFLDVLMGEKSQHVDKVLSKNKIHEKETTNTDSTWDVLRDEFMMSAKMKDWDKELEEADDEEELNMEID